MNQVTIRSFYTPPKVVLTIFPDKLNILVHTGHNSYSIICVIQKENY